MASRYFSAEEANALLPWLREAIATVSQLQHDLTRARRQLSKLARQSRRNGSSGGESALGARQEDVENVTRRMNQVLHEIDQKGAIVRDLARGLVDFPAHREGREVCLCWTVDEPEVSFWHEADAGYGGRQPL